MVLLTVVVVVVAHLGGICCVEEREVKDAREGVWLKRGSIGEGKRTLQNRRKGYTKKWEGTQRRFVEGYQDKKKNEKRR